MNELTEILNRLDGLADAVAALKKQTVRDASPWLTFSESCDYLKAGKTKLRQLLNDGRIRYCRLDGQIRIRRVDLDAFLLYNKPLRKLTKAQKGDIQQK